MEDQMKGQAGMRHPEDCKCPVCQGKMCGMCGMGGGCYGHSCWYHVIRWILGIAIIIIIFCFGVMIGQLKGAFESSGYRMMIRTPYYSNGYGDAYPMMQNGYYGGVPVTQPQTAPAAPATQSLP